MSPARTGLSIGVIVALAVAIWAAVSSGNDEVPATGSTSSTASSTSVSTSSSTTTTETTSAPTTSVAGTTTDPEARTEEVRLILEDLYFRWFDAIYRNDEEAVMDVVALQSELEAFRAAVDGLDLPSAPQREEIVISEVEILRDDVDCLVAYSTLDLQQWQGEDAIRVGVDVLYPHEGAWRFATHWIGKEDMWSADCDAERVGELP